MTDHAITATITARGTDSSFPSDPTAVDAEITIDGIAVADVSLYADGGTGRLSIDEAIPTEVWCTGKYAAILDEMDEDKRDDVILGIEQAVRAAVAMAGMARLTAAAMDLGDAVHDATSALISLAKSATP